MSDRSVLAERGAALLTGAAALLLILAATWPPESEPWSRALCQAVAAVVLVILAARRETGAPPAWALLLLPLPVAAILFASCRARAVDEAAAASVLVVAAILGRTLAREQRGQALVPLLVALGSLAALRAVAQHHVFFPGAAAAIRSERPEESGELLGRLLSGRPSGPFSLPAALGGFLALGLPAAASMALRPGRASVRLAAAAGLLVQAYALFLSRSVGAVAATCAGLLILAPAMAPARRRSVAGALLLGAAVLAGFFLFARRAEILQAPGGDPLSLRAGNWGAALSMIRDHPVLGTGPGSFGTFYPRYLRPGMNETRYAHNSYLQIAAGWGLWAIVPLLSLVGAAWRATRQAVRARAPETALLAGAWTFLIHNLVDFTAYLPGVAIPAALLLGLGLGGGASPRAGRGSGAPRAAGVLAALVAAVALAWHGAAAAGCAADLERAREAALQGDVGRAADIARHAASLRPGHPDPRQFLAELILAEKAGDAAALEQGAEAAERAVALDPEAAILHHTRALYSRALGDGGAAYREEYAAHRLYPLKTVYLPESAAGKGRTP